MTSRLRSLPVCAALLASGTALVAQTRVLPVEAASGSARDR